MCPEIWLFDIMLVGRRPPSNSLQFLNQHQSHFKVHKQSHELSLLKPRVSKAFHPAVSTSMPPLGGTRRPVLVNCSALIIATRHRWQVGACLLLRGGQWAELPQCAEQKVDCSELPCCTAALLQAGPEDTYRGGILRAEETLHLGSWSHQKKNTLSDTGKCLFVTLVSSQKFNRDKVSWQF